jgi:hypothetical protein
MKKTLLFLSILLCFTTACKKKVEFINTQTINLGSTPSSTIINSVTPTISNGANVSVGMTLTEGSKYSLQVFDINNKNVASFGFTATSSLYTKTLDLSNLKSNDYSIVLIDIDGNQSKANIVIR